MPGCPPWLQERVPFQAPGQAPPPRLGAENRASGNPPSRGASRPPSVLFAPSWPLPGWHPLPMQWARTAAVSGPHPGMRQVLSSRSPFPICKEGGRILESQVFGRQMGDGCSILSLHIVGPSQTSPPNALSWPQVIHVCSLRTGSVFHSGLGVW